jgi:hypothetical protein
MRNRYAKTQWKIAMQKSNAKIQCEISIQKRNVKSQCKNAHEIAMQKRTCKWRFKKSKNLERVGETNSTSFQQKNIPLRLIQ